MQAPKIIPEIYLNIIQDIGYVQFLSGVVNHINCSCLVA